MSFDLSDYIDVAERLALFYAKYPEGSLQGSWDVVAVGDKTFVVYEARAYRTADDKRPAHGKAWEPFPGATPYTKGSELMNSETSAWGRAIAALGIATSRAVASKQEMIRAEAQPVDVIDAGTADGIVAGIKALKLNYRAIGVMLGAAGVDGLRANSPKAVRERVESLTAEQAEALYAEMEKADDA